ncbi:MAG: formylmethanofuran dehydrogenase [Deltaproteobacteria bacterium]|nr:formylmethanofuran dehydrogenase [Deltaproteobacteria bacterium]
MKYNETLQKVIEFHGHICPGLAYGYRTAAAALAHLGKRAVDEEIVAVVENNSCAVDAIQVMTGCTFGKGNLIFNDYGKQVYTFFSRATGEGFRVSVHFERQESPEEKKVWEQSRREEKNPETDETVRDIKTRKVEAILSADEADVLTVQAVTLPLPPRAQIYPTLRCDKCGEKTMEPRIMEKGGMHLCIPCAEAEKKK